MSGTATNADPAANSWTINDPVLRLRLLGTERVFDLSPDERWLLGSSPECTIRLADPLGRVSRWHAELRHERDMWTVHDLKSKNGTKQNREDRLSFQLVPGDEVDLGGVTLIAESRRSIALHQLLRRLLGYAVSRLGDVDRAFREVRELAHVRAALLLRGEGSLLGIARRLHRITLLGRPFTVLDPGESADEAIDRASGGMLFAPASLLPEDLRPLVAGLRDPAARVRFVVAADNAEATAKLAAMMSRIATIWIPPIAERRDEIDLLIEAYGRDAVHELDAPELGFRPNDLKWVRSTGLRTHDEIEEVTHRLVALRNWGVTAGADRLGITHGALSRWARRRRIST